MCLMLDLYVILNILVLSDKFNLYLSHQPVFLPTVVKTQEFFGVRGARRLFPVFLMQSFAAVLVPQLEGIEQSNHVFYQHLQNHVSYLWDVLSSMWHSVLCC